MNGSMAERQQIQLAENLKRMMAAKNLSVTAAARKIGMNKSTLHGYCNGAIPRNLQKLKELADLFEVSLVELIFAHETEARTPSKGGFEGRYEVIVRRIDE